MNLEDLLGPLMFLGALIFIFTGFPVAFSLGGTALVFGALGIHYGFFDLKLMQAMPERIFGIMENYTLLAVPFLFSWAPCSSEPGWPRTF